MGSFSEATRDGWLDSLPTLWVQLHVGAPGAAGTSNPAVETTRHQVMRTLASAGSCINSSPVNWTSVAASETYTHISLWDASTAGVPLGTDDLPTPTAVSIGGDFTIGVGEIQLVIA